MLLGGGGGFYIVTPFKTLVSFWETIQVNFFRKLVQYWVLLLKFALYGNHGYRFKVVRNPQSFDSESLMKNKTLVPLDERGIMDFSESLPHTKSNDPIVVAMVIVALLVRSLKLKTSPKRKSSPARLLAEYQAQNFHKWFH